MPPSTITLEIAATAARLVVEEGLEYGPAKQRALKLLGKRGLQVTPRKAELPDNDLLEAEVRSYLALFCAETQPGELAALRQVALHWMERLAEFRPYATGAVWRGTATRLSDVHLQLYCDDSKSAEIALLGAGVVYDVGSVRGPQGRTVDVLSLAERGTVPGEVIPVHLSILDHDDLRGALKPDAQGRAQRGDAAALRRLMKAEA
ncbi:MAG: hypothetical protein H0W48_13965 [Methylibium sp.]|uniref:hypothetical protein n=1 Tax=Methylibium sp. TaxID=2067992 RepID=UPI0017B98628|nr:hypothetical protein [Methylibium sp.]MBA2721926.1 hypothetical protein [Methylibium sp.]MBA3591281.1 hypothetical protein [Methylibium sp.]MBA3625524.1 hypothetical protein [Methylibium sp.]